MNVLRILLKPDILNISPNCIIDVSDNKLYVSGLISF